MANKKLVHKFWYHGHTEDDVRKLQFFKTCELKQLTHRGTIMRMELKSEMSKEARLKYDQTIFEQDSLRAAKAGMTLEEYQEDMRREWAEEDEAEEEERMAQGKRKRKRSNPPPPFCLCYIWEKRSLHIMFRKTKCNPDGRATWC